MNKFACESRLDKPFPPYVYNTLSLKKRKVGRKLVTLIFKITYNLVKPYLQ